MKKYSICLKIVRHKLKRYSKKHPFIFCSLILYLGALFIYTAIFNLVFADPRKPMPLNEIGDFLSGVFAPLAFLFLYLGYKQQGHELQQNTKALNLQAAELKNSVEQQKELVDATREEIDLTKDEIIHQRNKQHIQSQPFFHFKNSILNYYSEDSHALTIFFKFSNSRATCRELGILINDITPNIGIGQVRVQEDYDLILGQNEKEYTLSPMQLPDHMKFNENNILILELTFQYFDSFDIEQNQKIQMVVEQRFHGEKNLVKFYRTID
ncbi:hypothetical protein [Acinetobacter pittii]|uniref:hypothetical protein n=1 Tax=Acinetobacter pittii TaxID=48296 RepID=UPI0024695A18|nr:hypothetical protein [Acinetobacter pittii]WGM26204.1 hypothetical protein OFU58_07930 [Acinetobacter pittii]